MEQEEHKPTDETMEEVEEYEEVEEDTEVEEIDVSLDEDEIDEWIGKLTELKESKEPITLELDSENEVKISYEEKSEEAQEEDEDDE